MQNAETDTQAGSARFIRVPKRQEYEGILLLCVAHLTSQAQYPSNNWAQDESELTRGSNSVRGDQCALDTFFPVLWPKHPLSQCLAINNIISFHEILVVKTKNKMLACATPMTL